MQHKCLVTVIDKKCFADFQNQYLADPKSGPCPFYNVGDTFLFERYDQDDTFWTMGRGSQCAEAWDCISRYIYSALQGGSIMRNWTNDERMMIACCNDGTRPVIFKIERQDYKVIRLDGLAELDEESIARLQAALAAVPGVDRVEIRTDRSWVEVFVQHGVDPADELLRNAAQQVSAVTVTGID